MQDWPRLSIFVLQGINSLIRPRRHAGADQDFLTAVCVTPLSTRPRIQQSCGLTAHERNRGLHYYPVCSSSCRRMASRYVRPPVVRRRCRETDPTPRGSPHRERDWPGAVPRVSCQSFIVVCWLWLVPGVRFCSHVPNYDFVQTFFSPGKRR